METLGETLQRARIVRGLTLQDVISRSKINPVYLDALESNDWSAIPSEVFARGFVKLYARCLELDERPLLEAHGPAIHAHFEAKDEKSLEAERRREELRRAEMARKSRAILAGMILLVVAGGGGALFYMGSRSDRSPDAQTRRGDEQPALSAASPENPPPSQKAVLPPTAIPGKPHELTLAARETTWAQVLIDNESTREVLLQPGDSVTWEAQQTFKLDIGNAGGVTVSLDGRELAPLGESGQILKGIVFPKADGAVNNTGG